MNNPDSYAKIHTPIKRRLSEYIMQKQNSYAQIHKPESQKQKSTPDVLELLKKYQRCHTQFNKKQKTNIEVSPIKVSYEALPLKNIIMNKKRSITEQQTFQKVQQLKRKINPLQLIQPDQLSNKITFQASQHTEELQTIESPGTAQFMQSNRDEYDQMKENKIETKIKNIQQRRSSNCEEAFKPVQKTVTKPYFESNQQQNFTNRLECRKIMLILDQDQEKILQEIDLNPADIHSSPTSSLWDKTMKIDRLSESMKQVQLSRSKRSSVNKDAYLKLRELEIKKKR